MSYRMRFHRVQGIPKESKKKGHSKGGCIYYVVFCFQSQGGGTTFGYNQGVRDIFFSPTEALFICTKHLINANSLCSDLEYKTLITSTN